MKILTISCFSYGNQGDNMYSEVLDHFLKDCEIKKLSDHSVFVDKDGVYSKDINKSDYDFDILILGGGGLVTPDKLKNSRNIIHYFNIAKKKSKKFIIISCGVQGLIDNKPPTKENFKSNYSDWVDLFNYASLITLRSPTDKDLVSTLTNDKNKIKYYRDLGYLFPHLGIVKLHKKVFKSIIIIPAGPVYTQNKDLVDIVNKIDNKNIILMNMGSINDDENNEKIKNSKIEGKTITKYYGSGFSNEFNFEKKENPSDLNLSIVLNTIYNSELVLTGRYHGMIFSRSLGIPYNTMGMGTNKMIWEEPIDENGIQDVIANSYNHIIDLRKCIGLETKEKFGNYENSVSLEISLILLLIFLVIFSIIIIISVKYIKK